MNDDEVLAAIEALGVKTSYVSLTGGLPPDRFCVEARDDRWAVYYSEKGGRYDETLHPTRSEALVELLARISAHPEWFQAPPTRGGVPPMRPPDTGASATAAAEWWQALGEQLRAAVQGTKDSGIVPSELSKQYVLLSEEERRGVDRVVADWVVSHDESVRFDAMFLIRRHEITAALPALQLLAGRLTDQPGPGPRHELANIHRLIAHLTGGE